MSASVEELQQTHEIGPRIAESILRFFSDRHNRELVKRLKDARLKFEAEKIALTPLTGRTFVITGTLSNMTREEVKGIIEKSGGRVALSVSNSIDCLIVGADAGLKLEKAKKLGIELWDEEKFLSILKKK